MGFGEIAKSTEGLVNLIMNYVNCNCEMKDKYKKRVDDFFEYHDKNNCKRVYEFILNDSVDEMPQELDAEKTNEILIDLGDDFYRNIDYEDRITKERIKNNQLREAIEGKDKEIEELNKELERKQKEINTLLGSNSWKVTKPLRKTTEMLKNNKGD